MMRLPSELVPTRPWEPAWWKVAPPMIKVDIPSGHVLLWRWPPAPNRGYGPSNPLEAAAPRRTGSRARAGAKFTDFPRVRGGIPLLTVTPLAMAR